MAKRLTREEKAHQINIDLINLMMEKFGITYDDIMSHLDDKKRWKIDGKDWYQYYSFTKAEADEFRKKGVDLIRKKLNITKKSAEKEMAWWYLFTGLTISDDSINEPYPIIGKVYNNEK